MTRWLPILALFLLLHGRPASAGLVEGVIQLPRNFDQDTPPATLSYWRVPNAVVELRAPSLDPRRFMVVVLEGSGLPNKPPLEPRATIQNAHFDPPVLPVTPGTTVTLLSNDGEPHYLEPVGPNKFMPGTSLGAKDLLHHRFAQEGIYVIRCSEVPHVELTVLVTPHEQATVPNNNGVFIFPEIPAGTYALRVWQGGEWIHKQALTVRSTGKTTIDVPLKSTAGRPYGY